MASADNFHSYLVGWSKIILPICGIGLLSTLFLFAKSNTTTSKFSITEIEMMAREQRINKPKFSGVADDGSVITISAKTAELNSTSPNLFNASDLSLSMRATDGSEIHITATTGEVDSTAKKARLRGLARLETSNGYRMETNGLVADLKSGSITSNGALEIRAPFGRITAGRVKFETANDVTGQQMLFTQGVQLIYTPNTNKSKDVTE